MLVYLFQRCDNSVLLLLISLGERSFCLDEIGNILCRKTISRRAKYLLRKTIVISSYTFITLIVKSLKTCNICYHQQLGLLWSYLTIVPVCVLTLGQRNYILYFTYLFRLFQSPFVVTFNAKLILIWSFIYTEPKVLLGDTLKCSNYFQIDKLLKNHICSFLVAF